MQKAAIGFELFPSRVWRAFFAKRFLLGDRTEGQKGRERVEAMEAAYELNESERELVLALRGDWTVWTVAALEAQLRLLAQRLGPGVIIDVSRLGRLDVAGAYLIDRTIRGEGGAASSAPIALRGDHPGAARLLQTARNAAQPSPPQPLAQSPWDVLSERVGRGVVAFAMEAYANVAFLGHALSVLGKLLLRPSRIRWTSVFATMETAGLNAFPIVMLLSFFIGLVVAYLSARVLGDFGLSVFTVELVAFSVMREFGAVITAVILAGRTNSAFTAEIGAMKMRQEIDAMRVMGLNPMAVLVAPRVIAMLIMTPLLTFAAIIWGLMGGMLVCWSELGVSPVMFASRIQEFVPAQHFWAGMVKAPIFALTLVLIGCRHGLETGGDVSSLGSRTTTSVVQGLFLVIVIDAIFALWFLEMDW